MGIGIIAGGVFPLLHMHHPVRLYLDNAPVYKAVCLLGDHLDRAAPLGFKIVSKLPGLEALLPFLEHRVALQHPEGVRHPHGKQFVSPEVDLHECRLQVNLPVPQVRLPVQQDFLVPDIKKNGISRTIIHPGIQDHPGARLTFRSGFQGIGRHKHRSGGSRNRVRANKRVRRQGSRHLRHYTHTRKQGGSQQGGNPGSEFCGQSDLMLFLYTIRRVFRSICGTLSEQNYAK